MNMPVPASKEDAKGERKRWLNEQRWRAPLLVLFFSLVLLLVLSVLVLTAWLTLQSQTALGPPQAAAPVVGSARITVDPPAGGAGTMLHVEGQGWSPNDVVFVSLEAPYSAGKTDFAYAGAVADEDGKFAVSFSFPDTGQWLRPGAIKVVAWAEQSGAKAVTIFQVAAPTAPEMPVQVSADGVPQATPVTTSTVTAQGVAIALVASPAAAQAVDWYGEYFANSDLSGAPAFVRDDPDVAFDWADAGPGGPRSKVAGANFSVRWTRQMVFTAGVYRFFARVDDGVRLWVDDKLIIDQWHDAATTTYVSDSYILPGAHRVRIEYYNGAGQAHARVWWERQEVYPDWKAEYFSGRLPDGKADVVRNDAQIRFNWSGDAPAPGIQADSFSVRWMRRAHFDQGLYRFYIRADTGMRVWLDSSLVIDLWNDPGSGLRTVNMSLGDGDYSVRVEYYSRGGSARAELRWDLIAAAPAAPAVTATPTGIQMAAQSVAVAPTATPAPRRTSTPTTARRATATPTKTAAKATAAKPTATPTKAPTTVQMSALAVAPQPTATDAPTEPTEMKLGAMSVAPQSSTPEPAMPEATALLPSPEASLTKPGTPEAETVTPTSTPSAPDVPGPTATPIVIQALMHAQASSAPESKPALAVQPSQVALGAEFTIKGQGWRAGDEVIISLVKPGEDLQAAPPFSRAMVDDQGSFALKVTLPDEPRWAGQPELIVLAHSIDWSTRLVTPLHVITPAADSPTP